MLFLESHSVFCNESNNNKGQQNMMSRKGKDLGLFVFWVERRRVFFLDHELFFILYLYDACKLFWVCAVLYQRVLATHLSSLEIQVSIIEWSFLKGGQGCLMSPLCLESQGCLLIPLYYVLSCSSAYSHHSLSLVFFLSTGPFSRLFSWKFMDIFH